MKKPPKSDERLPQKEIDARERDVLNHFLTTKPKPHKPIGKNNPQAKRRKKEKRSRG